MLGGVICDLREVQTKSGKGPMGFFQLEDQLGRIEAIVFPKSWGRELGEEDGAVPSDPEAAPGLVETFGDFILGLGDEPIFATGKLEAKTNDEGTVTAYKLLVSTIRPIAQVRQERTEAVLVELSADQLTDERLLALKHLVADHRGHCTMELRVRFQDRFTTKLIFGDEFRVDAGDALFVALERLFGEPVAKLV